MSDILPDYKRFVGKTPFLSIAAGKTLAYFTGHLGERAAVIRTMPNLAATVGSGVTVCTANDNIDIAQRKLAATLMQAVGSVHWTEESMMNAVTALSGSGPAYIFLLEEIFAEVAIELGLEHDLAAALARETIVGSADLLRKSPLPASELRAAVTSKGGTTEAALAVLMKNSEMLTLFKKRFECRSQSRAGSGRLILHFYGFFG